MSSRRRVELPDLWASTDFRDWLAGVIAARAAVRPDYTLSMFARACKVPEARLRGTLTRRNHLRPEDLAGISAHLRHDAATARFFARLVEFGMARGVDDRRLHLEALVGLLAARAETQGQGSAFRARSRWEHWMVHASLKRGVLRPEPELVAGWLGLSRERAEALLSDLATLGPEQAPPDTVKSGPGEDFATMLLLDDLMLLGMRRMERAPEQGRYGFFHWSVPSSAAASLADTLDVLHGPAAPTAVDDAHAALVPVLLLTHSVSATRRVEPR